MFYDSRFLIKFQSVFIIMCSVLKSSYQIGHLNAGIFFTFGV
jgi:hypothetical protein